MRVSLDESRGAGGGAHLDCGPCAESWGTSATSRRATSSSRDCGASSTAATTPPASRWSTAARSSRTSAPASWPTSRRPSRSSPLPPSTTGIGHTRWATHGAPNDTNAHPHLGQNGRVARGAQRHHRELRPAARRARARRATTCAPRPTPRSPRTCWRTRVEETGDLTTAMQAGLPPARGRLHPRRRRRAGPRPRGGRPPQLAAGRGPRRGRELPRLRRRRVHRAHPRGARARPGPGRHDHPRRRRGHRLRRRRPPRAAATTSTGTSRPPRRTASTGSCARRSSSSRAPSADALLGRHDGAGRAAARRGADHRGRAARRRPDRRDRLRHGQLRRPGRQVRHRALDPDPLRGRARPRVPLPRPDPDPQHARRRDQPVRARPPTP